MARTLFAMLLLTACGGGSASPSTSESTSTAGDETSGSSTVAVSEESCAAAGQVFVDGECQMACDADGVCPEGMACIEDPNGDEREMNEDGTTGPLLEPIRYCAIED
jgi:hypothetical protein